MGYGISYMPWSAIKSQALADFIVEWTETQLPPAPADLEYWIMYFDGSVMKEGARVGLVFVSPLGVRMRYSMRLHFTASNNVAEYEAFVNGLRIAVELGIRRLKIRGNSKFIVDQVMKKSDCKPKESERLKKSPSLPSEPKKTSSRPQRTRGLTRGLARGLTHAPMRKTTEPKMARMGRK
ncbi:unnamed protein product [Urochloa humidicola]